ncbi:hypothetical protein ALC57_14841 [Trachymyrmex cornetzi]|uniref:Uncharacterized protein n=1 Tax=Trachymyrmex cornetzi TaxID=471704 RepID=A0A151IXM1_9HYME|nr:hypothetical protein ALC57_14841 [Trachymyrmex cornetzi]
MKIYTENTNSDADFFIIPVIDLLLPKGFFSSNEFLEKQKYFKELENPCSKARTIHIIYHLFSFKQYMYEIMSQSHYNETFNIIKDCLLLYSEELYSEEPTIQKLYTQSIESNVDHKITASTLKDNSKLEVIPETEHENKNKTTIVTVLIRRI